VEQQRADHHQGQDDADGHLVEGEPGEVLGEAVAETQADAVVGADQVEAGDDLLHQ